MFDKDFLLGLAEFFVFALSWSLLLIAVVIIGFFEILNKVSIRIVIILKPILLDLYRKLVTLWWSFVFSWIFLDIMNINKVVFYAQFYDASIPLVILIVAHAVIYN